MGNHTLDCDICRQELHPSGEHAEDCPLAGKNDSMGTKAQKYAYAREKGWEAPTRIAELEEAIADGDRSVSYANDRRRVIEDEISEKCEEIAGYQAELDELREMEIKIPTFENLVEYIMSQAFYGASESMGDAYDALGGRRDSNGFRLDQIDDIQERLLSVNGSTETSKV